MWPASCPPTAMVARLRLPDGQVHAGCFVSAAGGLVQDFVACQPGPSQMTGHYNGYSLGFSWNASLVTRADNHPIDLWYLREADGISAGWGTQGDGCRIQTLRTGLVGAEVELVLVPPCRLNAREGAQGVLQVESLRVRTRVVQGRDTSGATHDAGPQDTVDCGAARFD